MSQIILPDYKPLAWQSTFDKEFHESGKLRGFLVWARRHGKDVASWNHMITRAAMRPGMYFYLYPYQTQARKAIWEAMTEDGRRFLDFIPYDLRAGKPNNTEMKVTLVNGSIIRILGSDNHDSFRSSNPIGVVFSEFAWHSPEIWPSIIEPILLKNKGWALFNTTPFGKNHAYDLWQTAQKNSSWYTSFVSNHESRLFSEEDLAQVRANPANTEEKVQQEYFCSWNRGVDGSYYGRAIHELRMKKRFREVDYDTYLEVHSAADIGYGDSTAIWFYSISGNEIHILDYYQNSGEGIPHYVGVMEKKAKEYGWRYGQHYWPHDAGSGSFDTGMSKAQRASELGLKVTVLPREKDKDTGIERVRKFLPRCYFDEKKTEYGIKCLENYRKRWDDKHRCYAEQPLHDWASDGADAFRYMCQAIEMMQGSTGLELDKYREMKMQFGVGGMRQNNSILGN